jgi:hypothetical protein
VERNERTFLYSIYIYIILVDNGSFGSIFFSFFFSFLAKNVLGF